MKKLPIIFIVLLFALPGWGANYYMTWTGGCTDNFGTNNCGTSTSTPKQWDATAFRSQFSNMNLGDGIYLQRGTNAKYLVGAGNGVSAQSLDIGTSAAGDWTSNYITIGSWGTGDLPIVYGGQELVGAAWTKDGNNYYWEAGAAITDWTRVNVIWVDDDPLELVASVEAIDAPGKWYKDTVAGRVYARFPADAAPGTFGSIMLSTYNNIWYFGAARVWRKIENLHIKYAGSTTGGAISMGGPNYYLSGLEISRCNTGLTISTADIIVRNLYIHHCWNGSSYLSENGTGYGIYISNANADRFDIRNTRIYDCYLGFYGANVAVDGGVFAYNLIDSVHVNYIDINMNLRSTDGTTIGIFNNTVIFNSDPHEYHGVRGHGMKSGVNPNVLIYNNAIYLTNIRGFCAAGACTQVQCSLLKTNYAGRIDHNAYYVHLPDPGADTYIDYHYGQLGDGGGFYDTYATWTTALTNSSIDGVADNAGDANTVFIPAETLSITPGLTSYTPPTGVVDKGIDVCARLVNATDMAGNSVCTSSSFTGKGAAPDIGAYEYQPTGIPAGLLMCQ